MQTLAPRTGPPDPASEPRTDTPSVERTDRVGASLPVAGFSRPALIDCASPPAPLESGQELSTVTVRCSQVLYGGPPSVATSLTHTLSVFWPSRNGVRCVSTTTVRS